MTDRLLARARPETGPAHRLQVRARARIPPRTSGEPCLTDCTGQCRYSTGRAVSLNW